MTDAKAIEDCKREIYLLQVKRILEFIDDKGKVFKKNNHFIDA